MIIRSIRKRDKPIGEVISKMVNTNKKLKKGLSEVNIEEIYTKAMGPMVKSYTSKISLSKKGVLNLHLTSAPLKSELQFQKEKLIKLINDQIGSDIVQSIRIL